MDKFGVVREDITPVPENDPKKDVALTKDDKAFKKLASREILDELAANVNQAKK